MFEDDDENVAPLDEDLPTWLILPAVLIGLGILAAIGLGYLIVVPQ
jgi:hypothetical protein